MKRNILSTGIAVFLTVFLDACGGATPIHFDAATLDPSQAAYFTNAASWPTTTPSPSPTSTSAFTATPVTPSLTPTPTIDPATIPIPADSHPEWTYYLGSPNDISNIAVDPEGRYVWAATKGGVLRWDSSSNSYTTYTRNNGLPDNSVTDIGITPDGKVWVGTTYGGLAVFDGSEWATYTTAQGLLDNDISEISISPEGILWIGYYRGGVSTFDGKEWTHWGPTYGLPKFAVTYIDLFTPNSVEVFSEGRTVVYNGANWSDSKDQVAPTIVDGAVTKDGTHWYAASKESLLQPNVSGLFEKRGEEFIYHRQCPHVSGKYAYALAVDKQGKMWVGTDKGIVLKDGGSWGSYTVQNGLPSNMVKDIAIGSDGRLWAGTDHGLALMGDNPLHWTVFTAAEEQDARLSGTIHALAFDANNVLWLSLGDGIIRVGATNTEFYAERTLKIGLPPDHIRPAPDGSVWFLGEKYILNYRSGKWQLLTASKDFPLSTIEASAVDPKGRLWIGEKQTIAFLEGGKWTTIDVSSAVPKLPERMTSIAVTEDGTVWVGSVQGLYQYRNEVWTYFGGFTSSAIYSLTPAANGEIWGVAGNKVTVYDGTDWLVYDGNGNFTDTILRIGENRDGKIYFVMKSKLVIYDGRDTEVVGVAEGFPPERVVTDIAFGVDNSVWLATYFGLMVFHPDQ
ncbi:MAG: two-component regulator propeller domain-containing protein [Anaerolineales bacterium]